MMLAATAALDQFVVGQARGHALRSMTLPFVVVILLLTAAALYVVRSRFPARIRQAEERLDGVEKHLSEYATYERYLRRKDRSDLRTTLASVSSTINPMQVWQFTMSGGMRSSLSDCQIRVKKASEFLDEFVAEYCSTEIERQSEFFRGRVFDDEQRSAIVKLDRYNLVVAAAGSGKTRTLTARIAYLVRRGVSPERILALAYTNSAVEEMKDRLNSEYAIARAHVTTFHSLARSVARLSQNFRTGVAAEADQAKLVDESVDYLRRDRDFAIKLLSFAAEWRASHEEVATPISPESYKGYLQSQPYTTLNGTRVKSVAERDIANFLFLNGVGFEYEVPAYWADRTAAFRQYTPDFFLRGYGIWIEHWAINKDGVVPSWFKDGLEGDPSQRYREGIKWKRAQFRKHGHTLIETAYFQHIDGSLIPSLRRKLEKNGVALRELTQAEILKRVGKLINDADQLREAMLYFINKAKTNGFAADEVEGRLSQVGLKPWQSAFGSLMIPVWRKYEELLQNSDRLDFNDMVSMARDVARSNHPGCPKYDHILVDEYQDITDPQVDLVQALLSGGEQSSLFCVGDDRQNIFSFAGSNIWNILDFGRKFPFHEQSSLSTNYRCPRNVVESAEFVARLNRSSLQVQRVVAFKQDSAPISILESAAENAAEYEEWEQAKAHEIIADIEARRRPGETVLVLSRTNAPLLRMKLAFPAAEKEGSAEFLSIHKAKGREADYVLLLRCIGGANGFPSDTQGRGLTEVVERNPVGDDGRLEEERRLFYVALTRCKREIYLFTWSKNSSRFIKELRTSGQRF